jgi:hypothetical protein
MRVRKTSRPASARRPKPAPRARSGPARPDTGDLAVTAAEIICTLPHYGPAIALGLWFEGYGEISSFRHIKLVAPLVATHFSEEWARWRRKDADPNLDKLAAGEVLGPDELIAALKPAAAAAVRVRSLIEREPEPVDATA